MIKSFVCCDFCQEPVCENRPAQVVECEDIDPETGAVVCGSCKDAAGRGLQFDFTDGVWKEGV